MNDCSYEMAFEIRAAIEKHDLRAIKKLAVKCPALLHHDTPHQWPVIHECMSCGCVDLELLKFFVRTGGDVNRRTESGVSLAYIATTLYERNDLVCFLRENGANMSRYEEAIVLMNGITPENKQARTIKLRGLLDRSPNLVHEVGDRGETLLHYAVSNFKYEFVPLLLNSGSNPNNVTSSGQSPLGICSPARTSEAESCRELLLRFGAIQSERERIAALILAGKSAEVVDALDKSPHLINSFIDQRGHCLHYAAQYGPDSTLVEYLLSHKVSPDVPDQDFETPLHRASHRALSKNDKTEEIIEALLKYGADINKASKEGNTPLHAFARRPWVDRIVFLVEFGAKLNIRNQSGQTALDIVCARRFPNYGRLAAWLKSKGAVRGNSKSAKKSRGGK